MDVAAIGRHFDELPADLRVFQALALDARAQADLFEAASGVRAMALDDLVPSSVPAMTGVPHDGANSLALLQ